jgi:energy-coupling factor transporter ATP-binding protein EcfA2
MLKGEGVSYIYEVFPVNFIMLSEERQDEIIDRFARFLNSLNNEVSIHIVKSKKAVEIGGETYEAVYNRFFLESRGEPIDHLLQYAGFKYQHTTEVPWVEPIKVLARHLLLPGGRMMKAFTIYYLPSSLIEGFITETYGVIERGLIKIKPIKHEEAAKKMEKYKALIGGLAEADRRVGRSVPEKVALKVARAEEAYRRIMSGLTRLFQVTVNLCVAGESERMLKDILHGRSIYIDSPAYLQYEMALGLEGKRMYMDTDTLACFFPFASEDIIETPGGIFLGVNALTGAPVIYDPMLRMNQNILIVGRSGSGKSFLCKIILTRLTQKYRNLAFFIIDPENEYGHVGRILGAQIVDIKPGKLLGLDPIQIFADSKDDAAGIIADICRIPPGSDLYFDLRSTVASSSTIFDLYRSATPELKRVLRNIIDGADRFLVAGNPLPFTGRMVFNLQPLHREFQFSPERSLTLHAASLLIFTKIWRMIDAGDIIPLQDPKLIIVDEVWMFTQLPAAARFLEGVSRRGRKRNLIFLLSTQRALDVLGSESGRTVLENCATKVLMRQDESAVRTVGEAFRLSNHEVDAIADLPVGRGILLAEGARVPVNFIASREEYTLFTTKPVERLI